jgi:hypothetical protein
LVKYVKKDDIGDEMLDENGNKIIDEVIVPNTNWDIKFDDMGDFVSKMPIPKKSEQLDSIFTSVE